MRIVRFSFDTQIKYGVLENNLVRTLTEEPFFSFKTGVDNKLAGESFSLEAVRLLAPCLPSKIVCLGVNYHDHARELNHKLPSNPLIFLKPSTAVIGPEDPIILPLNYQRVDYEGELGVVIGKKAKFITIDEARDFILGYTCFNDVTERQVQKDDGQWTRAKGFDTFAPLGPWIETDLNPDNLLLETYLNGELRQSARTSELIFGISSTLSFISNVMTLLPGDVIATGTPAGISPMKPGDVVEVKIDQIGTLRNQVYRLAEFR